MEWYIECGGTYNINNKNVFGRKIFINPNNIDEELKKCKKLKRIQKEIERIENKMKAEKQFNKKVELNKSILELKKQIEKNNKTLKEANKKSLELKKDSRDIKDKIDKLKVSKLNKDNYILSKDDKDSFINFIKQVDNINDEYDKIQTLSNTLINANEELENKDKQINILNENNKVLSLRVTTLNNTIKEKDDFER